MLSQDALEKLLKPIIDRQERISNYVIEKIAERIREIGQLKPSDIYKLERLLVMGGDIREINKELARLSGLQVQDIKKLIKEVALDNYIDAKRFYDYRHKAYLPFEHNLELQRVVSAISTVTANTYKNLSNTKVIGFEIRDLKNPSRTKFRSIAKTYKSVMDEAIQSVQSGTIDYNTAMRRTLQQLNESGLKTAVYESGYTRRLDSTVRMHLMDGIRNINQAVQNEVGRQFGADGKEITVHAMPAPDHEFVQGHQFSNEEFAKYQNDEDCVDYNGRVFPSGHRPIGELNCRHFTYSIILGYAKPNYTQEELDELIRKNHEGYVLPSGRRITLYECTQRQRMLETKIRENKDGQIIARKANDLELAQKYQAKVNKYVQQYYSFSKACGLSPQKTRLGVSGYKKISIK